MEHAGVKLGDPRQAGKTYIIPRTPEPKLRTAAAVFRAAGRQSAYLDMQEATSQEVFICHCRALGSIGYGGELRVRFIPALCVG